MIAYLQEQDATVEVPDDISEAELTDIQKNFGSYFQPETPEIGPAPETQEPMQGEEDPGEITEWKPNFYHSHIEPFVRSYFPESPNTPIESHSALDAFASSTFEGLTFGAYKEKQYEIAQKDHPVWSAAGQVMGGVGSLMISGGIVGATKLPAIAKAAGAVGTAFNAAAPRFIPRAIMSGATFGTNTYIRKSVQALQEGGVDPVEFGASVIKDTALGATLGTISGLKSAATAITSAAGLGFISAKMEGADNAEAALNAGIWGIFETVGSIGREIKLRRQAMSTLSETIGDYVKAKNPKIKPETAKGIGTAIIVREAEKATGKKGVEAVEAIINSEKDDALKLIEQINQKVRNPVKVPKAPNALPGSPEAATKAPAKSPAALTEPTTPDAGLPPEKYTNEGFKQLQIELKAAFARGEVTEEEIGRRINEYAVKIVGQKAEVASDVQSSDAIQAEIDKYENGDDNYTFGDMVGAVEAIAQDEGNQSILDAVKKYRQEQADDVELKGRGDMDQAEAEFLASVKASKPTPSEQTAQEPTPQPEPETPTSYDAHALPKAYEINPKLGKRAVTPKHNQPEWAEGTNKDILERLLDDLNMMESPRFTLKKDVSSEGYETVTGRDMYQGFWHNYLQGLDPKRKYDIPRIEKALRGEPITEKDHNRLIALAQAKLEVMKNEERLAAAKEQDLSGGAEAGSVDAETRRAFEDERAEREAIRGEEGSVEFNADEFQDTNPDKASSRNFGTDADRKVQLENDIKTKLGGLENFAAITGGPEIVKLAKSILGDVPSVQKVMRSLGSFSPSKEEIKIAADLFQENPLLWKAVLLHEIGHAADFMPDRSMAKGNILGRIASLQDYRASLLPESPQSTEQILTDADRTRLRAEATKIAKSGQQPKGPENQFDPQAVLNVFNTIEGGEKEPALLSYIKGLDTAHKKAIVIQAMQALKKGEQITIQDIGAFNRDANADPKKVADIYADLIRQEIKKRRLWEEEVITEELKALSMYWKPFDIAANPRFTAYRHSSVELYADFISALMLAPGKAKELAPNAFKAYFLYLEKKPEILKQLLELQGLIQGDDADMQKIRYKDLLDMFERGEDVMRDIQAKREAAKKSIWERLRMAVIDKNAPIYDAKKKLTKNQKLDPADDGVYAVEKNTMMSAFARAHAKEFDELVYTPADVEGVREQVSAMMALDRIAYDRSEMANFEGFDEQAAREVLSDLQKTDPIKYQKAQELAQKARDWYRQITMNAGSEHFFSKEQIWTMGLSDKYVPFRVQKYMQDYVSAGFASQVGSFEDIGDAMTALFKKGLSVAIAIERNRLKKITGEMLLKSGIEMTPEKINTGPGAFSIEKPKESYLGTIAWKDEGKWVAYHVDKYIADSINQAPTEKLGQIGGLINTIFANPFFRAAYITFNPGFQAVNLIRDFMRTWKNTPGLKLGQAFKLYVESIPDAKDRVKGNFNPLIQEMEKAGALQLTLNDMILGQTGEDRELEREFQKYDILKNPESKAKGIPVLEQIVKLLDLMRYSGDVIEALPKIVGWKALDQMPEEERAYFVRNLIGTPNPKRSGTATPITNSIFLFSNIFKEGYRGMIETGFTNPKTRKNYWAKTLMTTMLPKIIMAMAGAGAFGVGIKKVMDKASEYHKTNYIVIPLGVDERGNGVYVTLPQDEDARFFGGLFWKMLNHNGNVMKNLTDILSFGAQQFPSNAPGFQIVSNWVKYMAGGTPYDDFRDQPVLTEQERDAGGMDAFEPMMRWTLNETGLLRLDVRDRLKDEPIYKTFVTSMPILQRFIRVGRTGERETAQEAAKPVAQEEARRSLGIKQMARDAIRAGKSVQEFTREAPDRDTRDKMERSFNDLMKGFTSDPIVQALNSAGSNVQKAAILKEGLKGFENQEDAQAFIQALRKNRIISNDVLRAMRKEGQEK